MDIAIILLANMHFDTLRRLFRERIWRGKEKKEHAKKTGLKMWETRSQ